MLVGERAGVSLIKLFIWPAMKNEVGEPPASAPAAPGTEAEILASGGTCTPHYEFSNGPWALSIWSSHPRNYSLRSSTE
ncbi:hypothetical protein M0657_005097 [Pyricularia oryzae]|nr:hypothetical protein M9X92_010032 [Pyricularia oryzae]KAI7923533.1 hypothetical protein M0657_005097 [Pyricularia oryzae]